MCKKFEAKEYQKRKSPNHNYNIETIEQIKSSSTN